MKQPHYTLSKSSCNIPLQRWTTLPKIGGEVTIEPAPTQSYLRRPSSSSALSAASFSSDTLPSFHNILPVTSVPHGNGHLQTQIPSLNLEREPEETVHVIAPPVQFVNPLVEELNSIRSHTSYESTEERSEAGSDDEDDDEDQVGMVRIGSSGMMSNILQVHQGADPGFASKQNIMGPFKKLLDSSNTRLFDNEVSRNSMVSYAGEVVIKSPQPIPAYLQLKDGALFISEETQKSSYILAKNITKLAWEHVCPDRDVIYSDKSFVIFDKESNCHMHVRASSHEDQDMWLAMLDASRIQLMIALYNSKFSITQSCQYQESDLDVYEATIRAIGRTQRTSSEENLSNSYGFVTAALELNPFQASVAHRIVRASSWSLRNKLLVNMDKDIGKSRYYQESVMRDPNTWSSIQKKEKHRVTRLLRINHHKCFNNLSNFDAKSIYADAHQLYRILFERIVQYESRKALLDGQSIGPKEYVTSLSAQAQSILTQFSEFYGISENFQHLAALDTYARSLNFTPNHLGAVSHRLETLVSRVKGDKGPNAGEHSLTQLEIDGLIFVIERTYPHIDKKLRYFLGYFPANKPRGCISQLIRFIFHVIVLEFRLHPQDAAATEFIYEYLVDLIRAASFRNCERMLEAARIGESIQGENSEAESSDILRTERALSYLEYLSLLELILNESSVLYHFSDEFPDNIDYTTIIMTEYANLLSNETLFIARESTLPRPDPATAMSICKLWHELRSMLSVTTISWPEVSWVEILQDDIHAWVANFIKGIELELNEISIQELDQASNAIKMIAKSIDDHLAILVDSFGPYELTSPGSKAHILYDEFVRGTIQVLCKHLQALPASYVTPSIAGTTNADQAVDKAIALLNLAGLVGDMIGGYFDHIASRPCGDDSWISPDDVSLLGESNIPELALQLRESLREAEVELSIASTSHIFSPYVQELMEVTKSFIDENVLEAETNVLVERDNGIVMNGKPTGLRRVEKRLALAIKGAMTPTLNDMDQVLYKMYERLSADIFQNILQLVWENTSLAIFQVVVAAQQTRKNTLPSAISVSRCILEVFAEFLHNSGSGLTRSLASNAISALTRMAGDLEKK
eukprot:TRINITY_DN1912_c0_g2_i2.p1 TRINITY_DN1912_c0_g2~~TRINITY_DN1912_c0_g2_i2.p1  ORF type:complete len:1161 (+),score=195.61 TRINITY_DN1912_c0_g2_i2:205-3483(+)